MENQKESESVSENKNESENKIENESVSESESVSENKNENENESESESESVSENENERHHPFHEEHPLVLVAEQSNEGLKAYCDGCGELLSAPCFTCIHCNYHLHKQCAEAPLRIPNHPLHPQHSDKVHKKCISLPRIIKFSRHDHCIFHKYFLQTQELTKQDCKICFKEVKLDRGSYSCGKPGCNYVAHVNCVLEDDDLYELIEEEKKWEELYEKSMQSSIIRVIEVNEAGEAIKIDHFSHQHCLVLAGKMDEEIDRKYDGCMLPISNIFYYCSECPFFLHKTCAGLPSIKQHWFHQSNAIIYFKGFQRCIFCFRCCSGFFYKINEMWDMCLRCAKVADIIECEGHQHFLFFDFNYEEKCNGCGADSDYGTLPHSALHKIDEHMLKLTYDDDKEQSYCDICERKRDPRLWYYSCSMCDTTAHPKCVLGKFPFVKDGVTFPSYKHNHRHELKFFRKAKGYPECSRCGKLFQEEILKCKKSTCNYIIHCKCRN
ncbi:hypothetical protein PVK06_021515 [Gossypium arboreum]|uniref:Phorbol-ester/DAG-type domain-containing protein n=1 Tax=Gossypium arboreum TaxID=29729 RepID=A0ABR0PQI4_GOSAR|nr:hypothetical protein PVK06_021515 [Gossypium arboreum]